MKMELKRFTIVTLAIAFAFLCNSGQIALASEVIGNSGQDTGQSSLMEYVYDENSRLIEVKKAGKTIAILYYDKNGNLLSIQKVS